ncbi:hypothetical protein M6G65_23900 [Methylobacterium tardum]|nr:hypothetical protein [Methylobacterium tardum]URD35513.1 hypothetical protein M6G65_23900 [Methylobacterium tardum]
MVEDHAAEHGAAQGADIGGDLQEGEQAAAALGGHEADPVGLGRGREAGAGPLHEAEQDDHPGLAREGEAELGQRQARQGADHHQLVAVAVAHPSPEAAGQGDSQHRGDVGAGGRDAEHGLRRAELPEAQRPERPAHLHGAHGDELDREQQADDAGRA